MKPPVRWVGLVILCSAGCAGPVYETSHVRVHYDTRLEGERLAAVARVVGDAADRDARALARLFGRSGEAVDLYFVEPGEGPAPDEPAPCVAASRDGLVGYYNPLTGNTVVFKRAAATVEVMPDRRVLRHELAHVVSYRALDRLVPPRWFCEGLAEWIASGLVVEGRFVPLPLDDGARLRVPAGKGRAVIDELLEWGWLDGSLDYAKAQALVGFLIAREGGPGAPGAPFVAALRRILERPDDEIRALAGEFDRDLARRADAAPALDGALASPDAADRLEAVAALYLFSDVDRTVRLERVLGDPDPEVAAVAALTLAHSARPEPGEVLGPEGERLARRMARRLLELPAAHGVNLAAALRILTGEGPDVLALVIAESGIAAEDPRLAEVRRWWRDWLDARPPG